MAITKRTQRVIADLKYDVAARDRRISYLEGEVARVRESMNNQARVTREFTAQVAEKIADAEKYKAAEDQRFNGVMQATLQTAIATALGRRP